MVYKKTNHFYPIPKSSMMRAQSRMNNLALPAGSYYHRIGNQTTASDTGNAAYTVHTATSHTGTCTANCSNAEN